MPVAAQLEAGQTPITGSSYVTVVVRAARLWDVRYRPTGGGRLGRRAEWAAQRRNVSLICWWISNESSPPRLRPLAKDRKNIFSELASYLASFSVANWTQTFWRFAQIDRHSILSSFFLLYDEKNRVIALTWLFHLLIPKTESLRFRWGIGNNYSSYNCSNSILHLG